MVFLFVCVASFFTMATFWRYIGFAWFIRKDKDFLQVQSEQCKKLCSVIPSLEKCLKDMEASSKAKVLNKNQCVHLYGKFILVMKGIDKMLSSATKDLKFQSIFEELCCLQREVEIVGKNCIEDERWCHSAVFQLPNKETFRELLLDLKCCYNAACDVYLILHPNQENGMVPIQFDATTYEQVLEDEEVLKKKLELILLGEVSKDCEMAQHLLLRLRNVDRFIGGDLDALEIPLDFKPPKLIKEIGKGSYGHVYKSNWLGITSATKVLEGDLEFLSNSRKEASILASLSHPNLVQFFGCGIYKTGNQNDQGKEICEMHLVMELMESSLSQILKKVKRPLPYHLAIDIMHQIAKGVYYLHDMQVAHLDLKPDNVLSSSISIEDLDPCCIFKVTDYGTSQLEVYDNPEHPKPSKYTIGSIGYMAPETIKGKRTPLYPFQVDVWSFAMICSEILSGKVPYFGLKRKDFYDQISHTHGTGIKSFRPTLPNNCEELTNLIEDCWNQDPLQRPTFFNICKRLASLKKLFLKGTYSCKMVPQFGPSSTFKDSKFIMDRVLKVDELISPPKEVPIVFDHQLSKVRGLLRMNYIGIVGPGGIGKTTLAKAIFQDMTILCSYTGFCFIEKCKNYQSSYDLLCKILSKLGIDKKPKSLKLAQEMMKDLFIQMYIILILDDIKDEAQVYDIVPPHIVEASEGNTVIITTREWSSIESIVGIEGRLEVESLDEKAATMLFTTHLSWNEGSLSPNFVALRKHIVKACNGLPLSLKGTGTFLCRKERLRSWERALQRIARGRTLDGDEELWNTLKINFDGFSSDVEKSMFLDAACFFCRDVHPFGISKETLLYMWSRDGILPWNEFESLVNMSLLKLNEDGETVEMHDHLRDMGRMFAKNTRIWKASMIPESGFTSENVEVLEGISWQGTMNHMPLIKIGHSFQFENLRILMLVSALGNLDAHFDNLNILLQFASRCSRLEAIIIENSQSSIELPHTLPTDSAITLQNRISNLCATCASLKILDLRGLEFLEQLPNKFVSSHTLLRLNLNSCSHLATLPKEVGNLLFLQTLDLGGCVSLTTLPKEVGKLSSLTTLNLSWCSNLVALPKELEDLSSLTTLNLRNCSSLVALPNEVGSLSSLNTLDLMGCSSLVALPKEVGNLSSLTTLHLSGHSNLATLPKEVGNLSSLTTLNLSRCSSLVVLPNEVGNLSSLTTLILDECTRLVALPNKVENLSSLITLNLRKCSSLVALPSEVGNLSSLTTLDLCWCSSLKALPKEVGNLSSLTTLHLFMGSSLAALPKEVGNLTSLRSLNLYGCSSLVTLPKEVENLSSLEILNLCQCRNLVALPKEIGNLFSLTNFYLIGCSSLAALPKEVENLSSLINLFLIECSSLAALPKEVGNLSSLTKLDLMGCSSLVALPKDVGNLSSLTTLNLRECSSLVVLPKEVGNLSSLTTLDLMGCPNFVALPKEVGNLTSLATLNLGKCSSLATLLKEVGNLSSLTTLNLKECSSLAALPKEVGNLSSLTTLNLRECSSLVVLPKQVGNLSSLTTLNLRECSSLVALPKEVGSLSSLITLDLMGCSNLVVLPKEVESLSFLTTLNLSGCLSFVALPMEVWNLSSLTTFHLSMYSNFMALPKEVGNLTSLTTLEIGGCPSFVELPLEVWNLTSLTILKLSECLGLTTLPKEVENLSSLTTLNLRKCSSLVALPNEVGNLSSLTSLNLKGCSSLVALPKEVGNFSSLTTLHLSGCSSLATLPKEVENLTSLTTLKMGGCSSLVELPLKVWNLTSLTTFKLGGCSSLSTLPKEVGNLTSLKTLNLDGCSSLVTLPKEVGNLSFLTTIKLGGCSSLMALPKEVEKLYNLVEMNLDGCTLLSSLPKNLGFIPSIRILSWNNCLNLEPYMLVEMSSPTSLASLEGKFFCLEGNHHDGVQCNECQVVPIIGPRLKAKVTFKIDYDLCLECFTKWKLSLENPSQ